MTDLPPPAELEQAVMDALDGYQADQMDRAAQALDRIWRCGPRAIHAASYAFAAVTIPADSRPDELAIPLVTDSAGDLVPIDRIGVGERMAMQFVVALANRDEDQADALFLALMSFDGPDGFERQVSFLVMLLSWAGQAIIGAQAGRWQQMREQWRSN